jgi:hypothetical protein
VLKERKHHENNRARNERTGTSGEQIRGICQVEEKHKKEGVTLSGVPLLHQTIWRLIDMSIQHTLEEVENHFKQQQQLMGNLADTDSFGMIFGLINKIHELNEETDKLTALNRHYYFKFYNGSIDQMMKDNAYLVDQEQIIQKEGR